MKGLMQDGPLTLVSLFERCERYFPTKGIMTATASGIERATYGEWARRTRRLGGVLDALGISADGRVATFAWNTARHLELYFAAPCTGRVLHTLNIRLFPEQLTYIVNHAEDEVIFVDRSLAALLCPLLPTFTHRQATSCVMDDGKGDVPDADGARRATTTRSCSATPSPVEFHVDDESQAGVDVLHERHHRQPEGRRLLAPLDVPAHDGRDAGRLARRARVGRDPAGRADVPRQRLGPGPRRSRLRRRRWSCPGPIFAAGDRRPDRGRAGHGGRRRAHHLDGRAARAEGPGHVGAAGHPVRRVGGAQGAVRGLPRAGRAADPAGVGHDRDQPGRVDRLHRRARSRPARRASWPTCADRGPGVARASSSASSTPARPTQLPWDGESQRRAAGAGARGSRRRYYNDDRAAESFTDDGWLRTGDVATVDAEGYIRLVDRTKDLIKSGGEWISSVELENEIMAHPKVAEAAVIGVPHPRSGPSGRWRASW